jgi:hypothetical protein
MSVYVHKDRGQSRLLFGRTTSRDPWFSLTADSEDELHAFAARLGLQRNMFHPGTPTGPRRMPVSGHYDVTMGERDRAVALGARPITPQKEESRVVTLAADAQVIGDPGREPLPQRSGAPVNAPLLANVPPVLRPARRGVLEDFLTAVHGHVEQAVYRPHGLRGPAGGPVGLEHPLAVTQVADNRAEPPPRDQRIAGGLH